MTAGHLDVGQMVKNRGHIYRYHCSLAGGILFCMRARVQCIISPRGCQPEAEIFSYSTVLYDFTARMHEDDIVYIHQRAQRVGIALKTKYSPLVDITPSALILLFASKLYCIISHILIIMGFIKFL